MGYRRPYSIGVTGVMSSGKSTICRFLEKEYGFYWIDADSVTHELYGANKAGWRKIHEYFGSYYVGPRGVHRKRLRNLVLKSPQKLWILNKLMHPLVCNEVNKKIVQLKKLYDKEQNNLRICIEAIYFEPHDLGRWVNNIIVITATEACIKERLKKKSQDSEELIKLYKFQKRNLTFETGVFIDNNGTLKALYAHAQAALRMCGII